MPIGLKGRLAVLGPFLMGGKISRTTVKAKRFSDTCRETRFFQGVQEVRTVRISLGKDRRIMNTTVSGVDAIRLHVLYHAAEEPIFGLGMVEELDRYGYRISPGTLYPLLHGLKKKGYLKTTYQRNGK